MHFWHISAKIQPKIWNLFMFSSHQCEATFDWGGRFSWSLLGYTVAHHLRLTFTHQHKLH